MKKLKLLYLSCHSIAEYDECKLFHELGFEVYPHGAYTIPSKPGDPKRPALPFDTPDWFDKEARANPKEKMSREFLEKFDIIFSHWKPDWLLANWERMTDKIVILRTNGQSSPDDEVNIAQLMDAGCLIVRYSPIEKVISGYAGHDAVIRFYKDPDEFKGYTGVKKRVITVCQSMKRRHAFCGWKYFKFCTKGFSRKLYGSDNADAGKIWGGQLSYDNLKKQYKENRVYFYTGTTPASYTLNFIEAMMTGIPIVAIGGELGNPAYLENQYTYEIPFIIADGVDGFWSDNLEVLRTHIRRLMDDREYAKKIGAAGRKRAIQLFGKETISKQWSTFFNKIIFHYYSQVADS